MPEAPPRLVSLRRSILTRLGLLVSGTALLLGLGYALFGMRPIVEQVAESQFNVAATQVKAGLGGMFAPARRLLLMSRGWLGIQAPGLDAPDDFIRLFRPVLETLPQFTSVVAIGATA